MRTLATLTCLCCAALLAPACSANSVGPGKSVTRSAGEIVAGTRDSSPGAVALVVGTEVVCSGTVVSRHAVLTSAACIAPHTSGTIVAFFGDDLDGVGTNIPVRTVTPHVAFDAITRDNDLAILELDSDAPVAAVPYPRVGESPGEDVPVRVIGFGVDDPTAPSSAGTKRSALATIVQLDESDGGSTFVTAWSDGSRACLGDAGGPAVIAVDGVERLVGIVSASDEECGEYTLFVRVEAYWAEFIGPAVAEMEARRETTTPDPGVGCPELAGGPECRDGAILSCVDDAVARTDCVAIGESCVSGDSACRPAESTVSGCGALDFQGECAGSGDVLRWCQDGTPAERDCSLDGRVCAWRDADVGFDCIDAMSSTTGGCLDSELTCSGGVCIPTSSLCDCVRDCPDGEDELDCGECPAL